MPVFNHIEVFRRYWIRKIWSIKLESPDQTKRVINGTPRVTIYLIVILINDYIYVYLTSLV